MRHVSTFSVPSTFDNGRHTASADGDGNTLKSPTKKIHNNVIYNQYKHYHVSNILGHYLAVQQSFRTRN